MAGTNALAFHVGSLIAAVKIFIAQALTIAWIKKDR
jgi:hypothetical protein